MPVMALIILAIPEVYAELECEDRALEDGFQYRTIEPLDYSITGGKFHGLCAEPDYLWYNISLETQDAGSLTITIPKDQLDLKQFDYESCYANDLHTNLAFDRNTAVTQIAQTDNSRTLKFVWSEPIDYIDYFGTYAIIDGVDYSEPNWCIGLVESGQKSAEIHIKTLDELYDEYCSGAEIMLNHTLDHGTVKRFCSPYHAGFLIHTQNIDADAIFTIDVPYTVLPLATNENIQKFRLKLDDTSIPQNETGNLITHQYLEYQTLEFNMPKSTSYSYLKFAAMFTIEAKDDGIDHEYNLTIPLLEIEDTDKESPSHTETEKIECRSEFVSLMKYDKSKSVCVTPATAEKLVQRGYGFFES